MNDIDIYVFPGTKTPGAFNEWYDAVSDAAFEWAEKNHLNVPVLLKFPHATGWVTAHMTLMYMGGVEYVRRGLPAEAIGAWAKGLLWCTQEVENRTREVDRDR